MKLLVSYGADINVQDFKGNTPLHIACQDHSISKLKILETMVTIPGLDVNIQNKLGQTCMHLFYASSHDKKTDSIGVKHILDAGADLELYTLDGKTVLLSALSSTYGSSSLVEMLLQYPKKPSISARTIPEGKTSLHLVSRFLKVDPLIWKKLGSHLVSRVGRA